MLQTTFDSSDEQCRRDSWNRRKCELNLVSIPPRREAFQVVRRPCAIEFLEKCVVRLRRKVRSPGRPSGPGVAKVERWPYVLGRVEWGWHRLETFLSSWASQLGRWCLGAMMLISRRWLLLDKPAGSLWIDWIVRQSTLFDDRRTGQPESRRYSASLSFNPDYSLPDTVS